MMPAGVHADARPARGDPVRHQGEDDRSPGCGAAAADGAARDGRRARGLPLRRATPASAEGIVLSAAGTACVRADKAGADLDMSGAVALACEMGAAGWAAAVLLAKFGSGLSAGLASRTAPADTGGLPMADGTRRVSVRLSLDTAASVNSGPREAGAQRADTTIDFPPATLSVQVTKRRVP
jgi:hypothetical protein